MDCLKRLREFYTQNRLEEVKFVEGQSKVSFGRGEYEFSGDIKTNFLSSIKNKEPYTLAQLLLYVQHWDKPHTEYAKLALKAHILPVYIADVQKLRAFLNRQQELDVPDEPQRTRRLEEGEEEGEEPIVRQEPPKKVRRKDIEGTLRSRENLLVISHKDFSNVMQVYSAAEKVYDAQVKAQQAKGKSSQQYKSSRMDKPANPTKQQQKLDVKIYGDGGAAGVSGSQKKKPPPQASSRHSSGTGAKPAHAAPAKPKQVPMILVPESEAALVNLFNAKQLLQDGDFIPMEQTAMIKEGKKKPRAVRVEKQMPSGETVKFDVIDQPPDAKSSKWELVVAVICSGKQWQFKQGFPFEGVKEQNFIEMFTHLCGFHFYYEGDAIPDTVKAWNVKCLPLNRTQRHHDKSRVQTFFDSLTAFLDDKRRGPDGKYKKGQLCRPDRLAYK